MQFILLKNGCIAIQLILQSQQMVLFQKLIKIMINHTTHQRADNS